MNRVYRSKHNNLTARELRDFLNQFTDKQLDDCLIASYSINQDAVQFDERKDSNNVITIGTFMSEESGVI